MCLHSIHDRFDPPQPIVQDGWKSFSGTEKAPKFANSALNGKMDVPLDKWLTAEKKTIAATWGGKYETGFHIYEFENETKKKFSGTVRRVYYRRASVRGQQDSLDVVIANEMYVPSNQDDWPPQL